MTQHAEVKLLSCKLIDVTPAAKGTSTFSRAFAANLAVSIQNEGLLNPITVRPHPTNKERFQLIAGRHRLYATKTINDEAEIACHVVDMSDAEAEIAGISENLWRHDSTKTQKIKSIQLWHAHYAARHTTNADFAASVEGQAKAISSTRATEEKQVPQNTATLIKDAASAPAEVSNKFAHTMSHITGESVRNSKRHVKIAKCFSPDELEVFEAQGLTGQQIELIAAGKDETKRGELVNLIASGLSFEESYKTVHGIKPNLTTASKEIKAEIREAESTASPEQSDAEWFKMHCGDKAALIQFTGQFYNAAILYRKVATARAKFRTAIKKAMAEQKAAGQHKNPMWCCLNRVISMSHPKDVFLCNTCQGRCTAENSEEQCPECLGAGFRMRTENYV